MTCDRCGASQSDGGHEDWLGYKNLCVSCQKELLPEPGTKRENRNGLTADKTRTQIIQGDMKMEVHQPHGALQIIQLYDGVELFSRVSDSARAETTIQLTWEDAETLRDELNEVLDER